MTEKQRVDPLLIYIGDLSECEVIKPKLAVG